MKVYSVDTGNFMLDGGAIFGVVPKAIWKKLYLEEQDNLINLSMRALLVDTGSRVVLVDTGMGKKQSEKFFSYYYPNGNGELVSSLNELGYTVNDITDVLVTHLHFDHVGGAVERTPEGVLQPTFPNAMYHISQIQWNEAHAPNKLERASYFLENFDPIQQAGQLNLIQAPGEFCKGIDIRIYNGHTRGLMVPFIKVNGNTLVYVSDLIPVLGNLPPNYFTSYDIEPLKIMDEKEQFLKEALDNKYTLFFEHDLKNECCNLKNTDKGPRVNEVFSLKDWMLAL